MRYSTQSGIQDRTANPVWIAIGSPRQLGCLLEACPRASGWRTGYHGDTEHNCWKLEVVTAAVSPPGAAEKSCVVVRAVRDVHAKLRASVDLPKAVVASNRFLLLLLVRRLLLCPLAPFGLPR